jgi:Fur family peroxide stress response transcriptional regulator
VSNIREELDRAFQSAALRPTAQRYAVLELLACRRLHATAEEIYHEINRGDPRSSRATVYNSLHSLAKAGLVREVQGEGKAARYDANLQPHHHFLCETCGAIEDLPWFDLPSGMERVAAGVREVRSYEIVFRGCCARCRKPRDRVR